MRSLLSVYDKTGITEFAGTLHELGIELISSGGTAQVIAEAGLPVTDVATLTGFPAMLGHRVVTLHPKVHGGILADRSDPSHQVDVESYQIPLIDLVVVNTYPFEDNPSVELIDIGGPAMIRAAAKNFEHVTVIVSRTDYPQILAQLESSYKAGRVETRWRTRLELAQKDFHFTSNYDRLIDKWLASKL